MKQVSKKYGVQNKQTGFVEDSFDNLHDAVGKCNLLNGRYANATEELKEFKIVFIVNGTIYDSERVYINS